MIPNLFILGSFNGIGYIFSGTSRFKFLMLSLWSPLTSQFSTFEAHCLGPSWSALRSSSPKELLETAGGMQAYTWSLVGDVPRPERDYDPTSDVWSLAFLGYLCVLFLAPGPRFMVTTSSRSLSSLTRPTPPHPAVS